MDRKEIYKMVLRIPHSDTIFINIWKSLSFSLLGAYGILKMRYIGIA